jgi:phosphatidylserine/phosphatidylglycerophosphate/cardiolipin synthase-like enzyme
VIVEHADLAKTFEAYLQNDLKCATPLQASGAAANAAAAALPPEAKALSPEPPIPSTTAPAQYFQPFEITNEEVTMQPLLTPDTGAGNYAANILKLVESATSKLYLQTQYIHPPKAGTDAAFQGLIDALKAKMQKGLDVKIILSEYEATGGWLEKLQAAGLDMSKVRIQNGVHNKGFVIDSKVVALGSQNWSGDGVLRNRDASLIIYHGGAAQYFEKIFMHDWTTLAKQKLSAPSGKASVAAP